MADAYVLIGDGAAHTVSLDSQGATFENDEATNGEGWEGVWMKIDLSTLSPGVDYFIPINMTKTGGDVGFAPYIDGFRVADASFDETNPDFTKLNFVRSDGSTRWGYVGDGTDTPTGPDTPPGVTLKGGSSYSSSLTANDSATGVFYLFFTDWNYAAYGVADVEYIAPALPNCLDAVDLINPDSGTASIVSGRVHEDWDGYWDYEANPDGVEATLKFPWAGAAGMYRVYGEGQMENSTPNIGLVYLLIRVNGRMFQPSGSTPTDDGTPFTVASYEGTTTAGLWNFQDDFPNGLWIPLSPGDDVEVLVVSDADNGASTWIAFEIERLCFVLDVEAPASSNCTPSWLVAAKPTGDSWGSPNGWGGQMLVPDQIWTDIGTIPYDESDFPWGVNYTDYDFCALADGTLYVINHDSSGSVASSPHYVVVKKYDPGTDLWTQIHTLNINDPDVDHNWVDGVSCETDGTTVWFVWWEVDTYTVGPPAKHLWKWHLVALDPSDDSITELGTGQNAEGVTTQAANYQNSEIAPEILPLPNGDVIVAASETLDLAVPANTLRIYVWHWDGAIWTNLALPDPTDIGTATDFEAAGENGFWDQITSMCAATASTGPINNGFTLVWCYRYVEAPLTTQYMTCTIEYIIGSGWQNEILTDWVSVEGDDRLPEFSGNPASTFPRSRLLLSPTLVWKTNEGKLCLSGDLLSLVEDIWDVWVMESGGTDWEIWNDEFPGVAALLWRETRNSSALGPDGEVYRAMISEAIPTDFTFIPKIAKTSPGYNVGFASALRRAFGEDPDNPSGAERWEAWMQATANVRIRIVGNKAWVMADLFTEGENDSTNSYGGAFGEGFYVFELTYVPCGGNIPILRPRVFSLAA